MAEKYPQNRELKGLITKDEKTVACQTLKDFHSVFEVNNISLAWSEQIPTHKLTRGCKRGANFAPF